MITASEVSERLAHMAESVAQRLLPNGTRKGREWCVGSVAGEEGESLKVCIGGDRAGMWKDFAGDHGGDLLDLWAAVHRMSIADALKQAKDYLGIKEPAFSGPAKREYRRPERPAGATRPRAKVADYLHGRGLTDEALRAYRVAGNDADDEIVFPFLRGSELLNVKYLKLDRPDGKKLVRQEKDCEPCLFGWQAIPDNARSVVLCEGELDALSWWQMGYPALSVWSGAGNVQWIENEWERLARFDTLYLSFDMDEAGKAGAANVVERLGRARCRIVKLPAKDANAALTGGFDRHCFRDFIDAADSLDPRELRNASQYADEVMARFFPPEGSHIGWDTPFQKLTDKRVLFRPAELVIVNGINGHGKTKFLGQCALSIMREGGKVCVASMEVKPAELLRSMTVQACATSEPTPSFIRHVQEYWDGRMWMFDCLGTAKAAYLLDVFRYARARYGITAFVVDSLAKCGLGEDDYNGQKLFVERLCDFKNETDSTVFLVTHSRKLDSEHRAVDKMDIKGTGAIGDLADTITTLWRNKAKEDKPADHSDEPDARWYWQKHRNGDWEGTCHLWFDAGTYQFRDRAEGKSKAYVPFVSMVGRSNEST